MYVVFLIVFLISGFWHGASWTFIIWGGLHALYQIIGITSKSFKKRIYEKLGPFRNIVFHGWLQKINVFILVSIAWVFFRADSFSKSCYMIKSIFTVY